MSDSRNFDTAAWLDELGLGQYAAAFAENEITREALAHLTAEDLKELGVAALGHRKILLNAIARLSVEPAESPAPAEPAIEKPSTSANVAAAAEASSPAMPPRTFIAPSKPALPPAPSTSPASIAPPLVLPTIPATPPPKSRRGLWAGLFASKFLFVSIAAHLLFGVGATYYIVQKIQAKRKVTFQGGPPVASASKRALEHKVSMAQKKKTGGAPPQAKRIVSAGLAKVSLPEMPSLPSSNNVVPGMTAGMGGAGFGTGMGFGSGSGSGLGGAGTGTGAGFSFFGFRGTGGAGLVGTFYDFKRDEQGKPTGVKQDRPLYTAILKDFASGSTWEVPKKYKHFTSKSKLSAKAFFFPAIRDTEAGDAFQSSETGPGMWIAHYTGSVTPTVSGSYRLVGWGDNVLIVGFNGRVVLDASDIGYVDRTRKSVGSVSFPKKGGTPMFEGDTVQVSAGTAIKVDVLLGDEGGIFCAGLLLQKQGEAAGKGQGGIPELPLFLTGSLSDQEKKLYRTYLGEKAFSGPVFNARAAGTGSLLDALKR